MNADRSRPVLITGLLAAALILSAVAWQSNPPREPLLLPAREDGSPSTDPTEAAFRATMLAFVAGTATPTPKATRPPIPTVTPQPLCTGDTSPGPVCWAATLVPTRTPTHAVTPPPPALPTWPGEDQATPGQAYQMGASDDETN